MKSFTYNTLDSSSKFYTEHIYDENGKHLADLDVTGEHKTQFEYVDKSGLVKTEKLPNGSKFSYGYDLADNLTAITQSTEDGEENSVSRVYEDGLLKKLVSGNTKIEYNYNFINRKIDTIWLNGAIEKGYSYSNGDKTVQVFDRDFKTISSTTKDDFGNIVEVKKGDTVIESNVYEKGLIKTSTKNAIRSTYNYDENVPGRLSSITYSNAVSKTFTYDECGNVTTKNYKENNKDNITTYTYSNDSKKKLTSVNLNNEYIISPQTDIHSRNVGKKFETANGVIIDEESITYAKFGDHATSLPSSIKYWNKTTQSFKDKLDYKYDSMGNIISITQNGKLLSKYTYDKLNRLVREDNTAFGKTYLFEYDNTGNITSKRTCPFTLEKKENISVFEEENTFSYIGDVLYGKDDVTCVHEHGRPTVYLGNAVTYKEDGLISSYKGINFLYDTCGKRQVKGSITFSYNNDGLLTKQFNGISFIYDHTSSLIGIKNGTTPYFFRKNIQGDIISILDNTGEVVVRYVYDAWGNHKAYAVNGNECVEVYDNVRGIATGYTNHIANLNPIRYRGYYFDVETGLYYLQTRYYDPQVGRFISPDSVDYLDPDSINGLNLYAYCNNNPIMYSDPTGHFLWGLLAAFVLLCTPIGGILTQAVVTGLTYAGIAVASIFDEDIRNDMNAIGWNPFNSSENIVLSSNKVSFYNGVPIFLTTHNAGSLSLGGIFLSQTAHQNDPIPLDQILKHERGHNAQLISMGLLNYLLFICIPSAWKNGDGTPWELSASMFGNSSMANGFSEERKQKAIDYFGYCLVPFGLIYKLHTIFST